MGFARLAEELPTESEGLVPCFFYHAKGASIIYDTATIFLSGRYPPVRGLVLFACVRIMKKEFSITAANNFLQSLREGASP
ncbi:hypothetical protein ACE4RR_20610 [Alteribacillus sp. HJP-4]